MSDNGATQFCTHTNNNTICDPCMGRPDHLVDANKKVHEPWVRFDLESESRMGESWQDMNERPDGEWIKYAPVEAWAKEVKDLIERLLHFAVTVDSEIACGEYVSKEVTEAQRLLEHWPVKEQP